MIFTCHHCRTLLPGYIQRELSPKQREWVSRHLSTCDGCYLNYMAQRQIMRDLAVNVPRIGSDAPHLNAIRAAVLMEIAQPTRKPVAYIDQARYSLVALLLVVALLLPLSIRTHSFSIPTPPQPEKITPQGTAIAALPATEAVTLTATLQANYAPVPGATDTP